MKFGNCSEGPWLVKLITSEVFTADGMAMTRSNFDQPSWIRDASDATLIAKAPEMLEALISHSMWEDSAESKEHMDELNEAWDYIIDDPIDEGYRSDGFPLTQLLIDIGEVEEVPYEKS
jgi:hypothetical protein